MGVNAYLLRLETDLHDLILLPLIGQEAVCVELDKAVETELEKASQEWHDLKLRLLFSNPTTSSSSILYTTEICLILQ